MLMHIKLRAMVMLSHMNLQYVLHSNFNSRPHNAYQRPKI